VLKFRKPTELRTISETDTNYATNQDDRRSVTGGLHAVGGTLVNWVSKTQQTVCLSSCEAELMGISAGAQEVKFINMILEEFGSCEKPATLCCDNTGATQIARNPQVSQRTKHIDARHCFVRGMEKDMELSTTFMRGERNASDVLTKNVTVSIHDRHSGHIRDGTLSETWEREDIKNNRPSVRA
jgi:hypothetical protein